MDALLLFVTYFAWVLLAILALKVAFFCWFSTIHFRRDKDRCLVENPSYNPMLSVIVPAYNEDVVLENCIASLLKQTYKKYEIIIVDDGSVDTTRRVGERLAMLHKEVRFFRKVNGGKASALNFGIEKARGEIVVCMDADSMFLPDTLAHLAHSFSDSDIVAVGGNVKVANRGKMLNKHQAVEYITGLNLQRRAFAHVRCMQVISGAIGAFRKDRLLEVGGYSTDTIVEDMDITVTLAKAGYRTEYNSNAIAYTEAPESISSFAKQRYRWVIGGFQVIRKHRDMLFNRKYGTMGMIGMPYFLIFPWMDVFISLLFLFSVVRVSVYGSFLDLLLFFVIMTLIQTFLIGYALHMDKENKRLLLLSGIESLWYNHMISLIVVIAGWNFLVGSKVTWNKFERLGKNFLPSATQAM